MSKHRAPRSVSRFAAVLLVLVASVGTVGAVGTAGCGGGGSVLAATPGQVIRGVLTDEDAYVRAEAMRLLGEVSGDAYIEELRAGMEDPALVVQLSALTALLERGDSEAERHVLRRISQGTTVERVALIELAMDVAASATRAEVLSRAAGDPDTAVRLAAMQRYATGDHVMQRQAVERYVEDDDLDLAATAFRALHQIDRVAAMDAMLRALRSDDAVDRERALRFAVDVPSPALWPAVRAYSESGSEDERRLALLVLGTLGDPSVESTLRQRALGGDAAESADALRALGRISSDRAYRQVRVARNDPRAEVREASLAALIELAAPFEDFEEFMYDPDPEIAHLALAEMVARDADRAITSVQTALAVSDEPARVMVALFHLSQHQNISELLAVAGPRFSELSDHPDPMVASIAVRLRLQQSGLEDVADDVLAGGRPSAMYALLEVALAEGGPHEDLYRAGFDTDFRMVQFAAALGLGAE